MFVGAGVFAGGGVFVAHGVVGADPQAFVISLSISLLNHSLSNDQLRFVAAFFSSFVSESVIVPVNHFFLISANFRNTKLLTTLSKSPHIVHNQVANASFVCVGLLLYASFILFNLSEISDCTE